MNERNFTMTMYSDQLAAQEQQQKLQKSKIEAGEKSWLATTLLAAIL